MSKKRKYYDDDFKKQIVNIYNQDNHTYRRLSKEYDIAISIIREWIII